MHPGPFSPELTGKIVQARYQPGENVITGYLEVFGVDSAVWTNAQTGSSTWSGWSSFNSCTELRSTN
jgi:hypothetical protein